MKKIISIAILSILLPTLAYAGFWDNVKSFFIKQKIEPQIEIQSEPMGNLTGTVCYPYQGCTGTSTTPTDLKFLLGRGDGSYFLATLTAGSNITISTSTTALTIAAVSTADGSSNWQFIGPNAVRPTTTVGIIVNASSTISQVLNLDNYLSFTATSTPTTPATNHLSVYAETTQGHTKLVFLDDDGLMFTMNRDNVFTAKNTSGSTINKGQAVYITGSTGNVPNVSPAKANSTSTLPGVGLATANISNNAFGEIMILGIISSIDTSAFSTGDRLFVSPTTAGNLTNMRPAYSNFAQRMGSVMVSGVGNGSIYVTTAPFVGGEENWTASSAGFTAKSLTISANGSATTTIASGISTFAGGLISQASSTFNGSITALGGFNGNASTADALFVNPTDCTNQFANAIAASGNLTCASVVDAYVDFTALTLADFTNDADYFKWANATSTYLPLRGGTITDLAVTYGISAATSTITATSTAGSLAVGTSNLYVSQTGNVGIGTATPGATLEIMSGVSSDNLRIGSSSGGNDYFKIGRNVSTGHLDFTSMQGAYGYTFMSGNVGIGTTTPAAKLTIVETGSQNPLNLWANATSVMSVDVSGNVAITGAMYQDIYGSDDGLVLYLPFSEGMTSSSASTAYDRSPFGNDGTATNMPMPTRNATSGESGWATTTCKVGSCMTFDGVNDYVDAGNGASLDVTAAITIEVWVKANELKNQRILRKGNAYRMSGPWSDGKFYHGIWIGGVDKQVATVSTYSASTWYHVVMTYDGAILRNFINGQADGTLTASGAIDVVAANLELGRWTGTTEVFNGSIDEVKIYNRALSAEEIRTHYLRGTNSNGTIVANKFRVVNTTNTVDFIVNAGDTGIGTSTPSAKLAVAGNIIGSGNIIIYGSATSKFQGGFISNSSSTFAATTTVNTGGFVVDGNRLYVSENGRVGIGTAAPGSNVEINDAGVVSLRLVGDNTADVNIMFRNTGDSDNYIYNDQSDSNTLKLFAGTGNSLAFETNDANERMRITSAGNVGIATTTPRYTLDVWGDMAIGTSTATSSSEVVPAFIVDSGNGPRVGIGTTTLSSNLLTIGTTTHALVVDNINQVGIGTSTPSAKLAVAGNIMGSGNMVVYGTAVTSTFSGGLAVGNNAALVVNQAASANSLYIATNGNVGIGTTTPTSLFTLSATGSLALPYGNPTVDNSGEIGINTDQASSSIRYYDGTAERAIFDVFEKSFWLSSTTDDENNNSFNDATSTFSLWNPARRVTLVGLFGKTDVGTVNFACGDGTNWTETIVATATGVEDDGSMTNNTFTQREDFQCKIGSALTVPSKITITAEFRYVAD